MAATNGTTNGHTNGHTNGTHGLPALSTSAEDFLKHDYDYVIVGGGTAGLAIAARLTENPDVTVGVLEAGPNKLGDMLIDVPALFTQLLGNPTYDWGFKSVPQEHNKGMVHQFPRGKALGGSSAINYMMYVRGSLQDYDDWAILADDPSWGAKSMSHYMRKHQTLEPISDKVVDRATMPFVGEHHGTSGPVRTSFNESFLPIEHDFIKACDEATGTAKKPTDPWSGDHIGFYNTLGAVARTGPNKGKRSYAARSYFETVSSHRPNLHVLCEAPVTAIELDGDRATGVSFEFDGQKHTAKTVREVIVCGGAYQTPQILELSGIGDPEILKAAGVECKIENRAVGANLQDHVLSLVGWDLEPGVLSSEVIYVPEVMADAQKQLMEKGEGPLTNIASVQGFWSYKAFASQSEQDEVLKSIQNDLDKVTPFQRKQYERVREHLKDDKSANLQVVFIPSRIGLEGVGDQSKLFAPPAPGAPMGITAAICSQYPLSRGTVHITSSDPKAHPRIDPAFLAHPADAAVLASGLKMAETAAQTSHLKDKIAKRTVPPSEVDLLDTKQAINAVHEVAVSEYHAMGSCALGDALDNRLMLKGAKNIRVADASVFPNNVSGNIVSSVYAVAEKAADMIKADWDHGALNKAQKTA